MRRPVRPMAALAGAMLAVVMAASPATAYVVVSQSGNISDYEIGDEQNGMRGANCLYETGSFDLDRITIRAPRNVHGDYSYKTWVGWRFYVQRDAHPVGTGGYSTIYTSSIQKDRADNAIPADDFTRRAWFASENPSGRYRVMIRIYWYAPGSQTNVQGTVLIRYEWYKAKWSGNFYVNQNWCNEDY